MSTKDFMSAGKTIVEDTRVFDEMGNVIFGGYGYVVDTPNTPNQSDAETKRLASHVLVQHNTNNSAPVPKVKLDFFPNILDSFTQYTYHWKLFITSLESAATGTVLNTENQTIIAESGVTDLTIDKVELHGIAGPSVEAGTGTQTLVKFEIIEPSGAGLIDKLYYESVSLGIGNWMVMPCYLQLEFKGRTEDTSESVESGAPGALGGLKWIWPIKLTDSKAHVTHVGTRYEFDAVVYDELAQSNSYFSILSNITLDRLTNFKNSMERLADKLNADQYAKLIDNYSIPDSYEIIVDPELYNAEIVKPQDNKSTAFGRDFIKFDEKTASYSAGTGIDKIIDSLLGNSNMFQTQLQGAVTPTSTPKTANEQTEQMKKLWRVVTETRPIAYDSLRQDNAVAITIYVVKYDLGITDVSAAQTGQTPETLPGAKMRLSEYLNKNILKKQYNYIFTGLNDQILGFDLNMNLSFACAVSRLGGVFYDSAISMPGVSVDKNKIEEATASATRQIRDILSFINNPKAGEDVDKKISEARAAIDKAVINPDIKSRYITLLDNAKPEKRKVFGKELVARGGLKSAGNFASDEELAKASRNAKSLVSETGFISDIDINSPKAQEAYKTAAATRKGKLRPVAFRESTQEASLRSIDPSNDSGRARTANIFASALHSSMDATLVQIKLTIKGDPFWLFPRSVPSDAQALPFKSLMSQNDAIKSIKFLHKNDVAGNPHNSANFYGTDNFLLIRFRTPRIYNEVTGITDPYTEVETFSGVYKVISVMSKFEMGKFSQELTCNLDPLIDLSDLKDFLSQIEVANGKNNTDDNYVNANYVEPKFTSFSNTKDELPDYVNPSWTRPKLSPPKLREDLPDYVNPSWVRPKFAPPAGPQSTLNDAVSDYINPSWIRQKLIKSGPGAGSSTQNIDITGAASNIPTILRNLK